MKFNMSNSQHTKIIEKICEEILHTNSSLHSWLNDYITSHQNRFIGDLNIVKRHFTKNSSVLEIGSSPPILTRALHNFNFDVKGLDIDPSRFHDFIKKYNLKIIKCNIEIDVLPFKENEFDYILMNEVFEHLRIDLIHSFTQINKTLKNNGLLVLSTPNFLSLMGIFNLVFRRRARSLIYDEFSKLSDLGHMGHIREYTVNEIIIFLSHFDMYPLKVYYRGSYIHGSFLKKFIFNTIFRILPFTRPYFTIVFRKKQ